MIFITYNDHSFILEFPYNSKEVQIVRDLPIRKYDKRKKSWVVHELAVETLDLLKDVYWDPVANKRRGLVKKAILRLIDSKFDSERDNKDDGSYLRNYQKTGVKFLSLAKKALLADDMGLGKSIQAIQTIVSLGSDRNLVLCPATLKLNWQNEFKKHFDIDAVVVDGKKDKREKVWLDENNKYIIANYDILAYDWDVIPKEWGSIICDEVVYLKNHSAQRTKLVKKLKSDLRIALSGMPIENHLMEFHSILEWVRPEIVPSYPKFKQRYINLDYRGKIHSYKNLEELHLLTSPYILRREKEKVLTELPPKIYSDFPLELDSSAKKAYDTICDDFYDWLREQKEEEEVGGSILEKLIRLRQFVEFPETVGFENVANVKLDWLSNIYDSIDKLVVFTYFRDSVKRLKNYFKTDFILTGETPSSERLSIVDRFNESSKGIFILTDAGRFGLNITGANYVAHFGYFYNPATIRQREDRLHRIGQKNTVNVLNPFIVETIDEGIRSVFLKRDIEANQFMSGSEKTDFDRLTREDIENMIRGSVLTKK